MGINLAAADLLLVDLERVAVLHIELLVGVSILRCICHLVKRVRPSMCNVVLCGLHLAPSLSQGGLTESGLSVGMTLCPSNKNRTLCGLLPCRSQKASISFFSAVERLILKKTSLLLSVTLMLRCSVCWGASSGLFAFGEPVSDIVGSS